MREFFRLRGVYLRLIESKGELRVKGRIWMWFSIRVCV